MVVDIIIKKSDKKILKKDAVIDGEKTISFGAKGYSDFTTHKDARQSLTRLRDEERKERHIARHKVNQDWKGYKTSGMWAINILWNKPAIEASVKDTNKKFPSGTSLFNRYRQLYY